MHLDPTLDDVKKLAGSCRRTAKAERVLFHYNGHGVPRPTVNGEIWVFNSRRAGGGVGGGWGPSRWRFFVCK
jgi:regulator-associated protein of mTOR